MITNETDEQYDPVDLIDFLFLAGGAAFPPLLIVAVAQWWVRRNRVAVAWLQRQTHQIVGRLPIASLPPVHEPPAAIPAPARATSIDVPAVGIDELAAGDNLLIVGGKGTGKTTLLAALVARRQGIHIVLDPHNEPGKWGTLRVIGGGRDYAAITRILTDAMQSLQVRYGRMNKQPGASFARTTFVWDEWRSIARSVAEAGDVVTSIVTEGRKVRLCVLAATHNDTVAALGCKGDKEAFMSSFDWHVYTGAFASREIPHCPTMDTPHGAIPALAYCFSVHKQRGYVLDLRTIAVTEQSSDDLLAALLGANGSERSRRSGECSMAFDGVRTPSNENTEHSDDAVRPENGGITATPDETERTAQTVAMIQSGSGKARAIEDVWGCKKGSSKQYQRAIFLVDAALDDRFTIAKRST